MHRETVLHKCRCSSVYKSCKHIRLRAIEISESVLFSAGVRFRYSSESTVPAGLNVLGGGL